MVVSLHMMVGSDIAAFVADRVEAGDDAAIAASEADEQIVPDPGGSGISPLRRYTEVEVSARRPCSWLRAKHVPRVQPT
jgi:hypothetical protein